jgi:DNA-binding MarR family transcriptional regulator
MDRKQETGEVFTVDLRMGGKSRFARKRLWQSTARQIAKVHEKFAEYLGRGDRELQVVAMFLTVAQSDDPVTMQSLQEGLGLSQASTSRNVRILYDSNLVESYEDPAYRRRKYVRLTAKGVRLMEEVASIVR